MCNHKTLWTWRTRIYSHTHKSTASTVDDGLLHGFCAVAKCSRKCFIVFVHAGSFPVKPLTFGQAIRLNYTHFHRVGFPLHQRFLCWTNNRTFVSPFYAERCAFVYRQFTKKKNTHTNRVVFAMPTACEGLSNVLVPEKQGVKSAISPNSDMIIFAVFGGQSHSFGVADTT